MMNQKPATYSEALSSGRLNWGIILFLVLSPIAALALGAAYVAREGFSWVDLAIFFAFYELAGLSITAGYHRYYAHRTYDCHPIGQFLLLFFGAASMENSALLWASDHRYHHQFADRDGDPYNINQGFFWAHWGWMFYKNPPRSFANVPDLRKNKWVMFQHDHYLAIAILSGFILPMLIGACFGRPIGGLLWGGLIRMVVLHHVTFMINSVAHTFGKKNYSESASARDSGLLALVSFGEGYHSYHHAYPSDYRNGIAWHHLDQGKWLINAMRWLGLARGLKRVTAERIASGRGIPVVAAVAAAPIALEATAQYR